MKRMFLITGVVLFLLMTNGQLQAEISQKVSLDKSVVLIRIVKQSWDYRQPWQQESIRQGVGSGFIIEGNQILTNAHNISDTRYIEIKKQNLAQRYIARIVHVGHDCDLALLEVTDPTFYNDMQPLEIGDIPLVNSTVLTVGFPMGGQDVSVTKGVVSRIQMDFYSHSGADSHLVIQTDAAINPGNSGGPVIQDDKVVGVAFQGLRQGDNIGYMIPSPVIRHFLTDVADGRYDGFGSLGVSTFTGLHSDSYRRYLKVPDNQQGVVVTDTLLGSTARELFQRGDVLVNIDGYDIDNDGNV
ncbi:MAG: serine protease, partial [Sedimentisphaerales bacterium]|nr:serine protease [Sedimentisphaerales bacterium]